MAIYMKFTGKQQGVFAGDVTTAGFIGQIAVASVGFGLGRPNSNNTQLATGGTVVRSLTLTKSMDKTSPLFLNAVARNEPGAVILTYTYDGGTTRKTVANVTLTNAMVQDFDHQAGPAGTAVETIVLNFTQIEFTWVDGGITSIIDMTTPG
ncbi:MAG: type VI secretion system tube protein Hcp [Acetobacteraceae bacterium]|nr:type VI secretion system tube protein Hcp [Acetobacteraceae bacterium]